MNKLSELVQQFPANQPEKLMPFTGTLTKRSTVHKKSVMSVVEGETESSSGTLRRSKSRKAIHVLSAEKPSSLDRDDSREEGKMSHTVERQLKSLFGRKQKVRRL